MKDLFSHASGSFFFFLYRIAYKMISKVVIIDTISSIKMSRLFILAIALCGAAASEEPHCCGPRKYSAVALEMSSIYRYGSPKANLYSVSTCMYLFSRFLSFLLKQPFFFVSHSFDS